MSTPKFPLTTTSYAILGQLAMQPWTAYALTKQMRNNLHYFWPRAESRIYSELRRLVADGYAESEARHTGKRRQTLYCMTDAGHDALRAWLARPPRRGFLLESEGVLRIFLALHGTREQALAALDQMREDAQDIVRIGAIVGAQFIEGTHPFQEQVHIRACLLDFLASFSQMITDWVDRTRPEIESWEDFSPEGKTERARAVIGAWMERWGADRPTNESFFASVDDAYLLTE